MSAVRKQGHRHWTAEQRLEQSRKLRERKIWLVSTGPKTVEGKTASSQNACKPDSYIKAAERAEMKLIKAYLRTQKNYITFLNYYIKQRDSASISLLNALNSKIKNLQNELIDIERALKSQKVK